MNIEKKLQHSFFYTRCSTIGIPLGEIPKLLKDETFVIFAHPIDEFY